jgi:hypothetical protein
MGCCGSSAKTADEAGVGTAAGGQQQKSATSSQRTGKGTDVGSATGIVPAAGSGGVGAARTLHVKGGSDAGGGRLSSNQPSSSGAGHGESRGGATTLTVHTAVEGISADNSPRHGAHTTDGSRTGGAGGGGRTNTNSPMPPEASSAALPHHPQTSPASVPVRAASLMLPPSSEQGPDTASGKLRSSLRSTGSRARIIPPKASPIAGSRKHTLGGGAGSNRGSEMAPLALTSGGMMAAAAGQAEPTRERTLSNVEQQQQQQHGRVGFSSNNGSGGIFGSAVLGGPAARGQHDGHAGHHGYGPLAVAAASGALNGPADHDASTQLNSDTHNNHSTLTLMHTDSALAVENGAAGGGGAGAGVGGGVLLGVSPTGGVGRVRRLRRQTSHKGLLSKLALQFPLIKNSFQRVHAVFQRYHQERKQRLLAMAGQSNSEVEAAASEAPATAAATNGAAPSSDALAVSTHTPQPAPTPDVNAPGIQPSDIGATTATAGDAAAASGASSPAAPIPSKPTALVDATAASSSSSSLKPSPTYMSEEIGLDQLKDVLSHVAGAGRDFSDSEVRALFSQSDLDHSKTISFREFLIAVSIGYFLVEPDDPTHTHDEEAVLRVATNVDVGNHHGGTNNHNNTASLSSPGRKRSSTEGGGNRAAAAAAAAAATASAAAAEAGQPVQSVDPTPSSSFVPAGGGGGGGAGAPPARAGASVGSAGALGLASFSARASPSSPPLSEFEQTARGFRVVQKAFRDIDEDHSGTGTSWPNCMRFSLCVHVLVGVLCSADCRSLISLSLSLSTCLFSFQWK